MSSNYDGTDTISGNTLTGAKLDRTLLFHGTTIPTNPNNEVLSNGLFLKTDTGVLYENTGTKASPTFTIRMQGTKLQAEGSTTPITDDLETNLTAGRHHYQHFTLPTTNDFYIITGVEWKNGTAVDGDVKVGVDLLDADPPVAPEVVTVAFGAPIAQSGTSAVQRNSFITSDLIPGGTILGGWFATSSATGEYRYNEESSENISKADSYTVDTPKLNDIAWTASGTTPYVKIYYKGIS